LIKYVKDRPGHDRRYSISTEKIKNLGWKPEHDLKSGLEKTVKWYVENENWWRRIKEKQDEYKRFYEAQYQDR
jgi:dTDP-glucose 4,6-dehydratase